MSGRREGSRGPRAPLDAACPAAFGNEDPGWCVCRACPSGRVRSRHRDRAARLFAPASAGRLAFCSRTRPSRCAGSSGARSADRASAVSQASADERAQALAGERERRELSPPVFAGGAERSRKTSARSLPVSAAPLGAADYARELQVLQPARAAVKRGDFTAALAAISEHRRRFGNGQLVEEREALRVRALAGLNRSAEARRAAEAFRKRFPHSVLQSGMKQLVESPP